MPLRVEILSLMTQKLKWRTRLLIFAVLIVPLYVIPTLLRSLMVGRTGWAIGVVLADVVGSLFVGFITNNYRLGILLYAGATAMELGLAWFGHHVTAAMWLGDAIPALVGIWFAQQLFVNMGD